MSRHRIKAKANLLVAIVLAALVLPAAGISATTPLANQLKDHASPYLALHGNDPVPWQDWGEAVIERAQQDNKLIFISSGYFSCHWCHVMQRESYSNQGIANQIQQLAIPVKIDRELQPALDAWLIDFTERTTGQAGWPLNVFLTPDGHPLAGMTYLPPANFSAVISKLQARWANEEDFLRQSALNAFQAMKPEKRTHSGAVPHKESNQRLADYLATQALQVGDEIEGGFGEQNKFPMSPQLLGLLDIQQRYPTERLAVFLQHTLDQMANLGLNDVIGGGFYRYVIDPSWDIPHFEKMLYDNALLARVYLRGAKVFNRADYLRTATTTLDFLIRVMRSENGAYIASLSAVDDKDVEGGYYLWSKQELEKLLDKKEMAAVTLVWDVQDAPDLEDGYHLKRVIDNKAAAAALGVAEKELVSTLAEARRKLLQARSQRILPQDDKILAGWNGLLLTSLSEAAASADKHYAEAADALYQFLATRLWDGTQLHRFLHAGKTSGRVSLEDYAYVAQGIASWADYANDETAWTIADKIARAGLARFNNSNGWQLSERLLIPYDAREPILADNTLPSSSAVLLASLLKIARHNEDAAMKKTINGYLNADYDELAASPLWYASHISLLFKSLD